MEVYISTDVETDGPIPGENSMLSFASAAFMPDGKLIGTFTVNLELLEGANPDKETMRNFWERFPDAWEASRTDLVHPEEAMNKYSEWLMKMKKNGKLVFVAYPLGFDFTFIYWYLVKFTGKSLFSHSGLDIKTFAMFMLNTEFRNTTKRTMPSRWFGKEDHTHQALDDAIEQGQLFFRMLKEYKERIVPLLNEA